MFFKFIVLIVIFGIIPWWLLRRSIAKHKSFMKRVKDGRQGVEVTTLGYCRAQISTPDGRFVVTEAEGQLVETPVPSRQVS